jgi:membrane protein YdbS with pleckstrin-like domain
MEFYVYLNGAKRGPFSEERLRSFLADGLLQPSDLASEQPEGGWRQLSAFRRFELPEAAGAAAASDVSELAALPPPLPTVKAPPAPIPAPEASRPLLVPGDAVPIPVESLGAYSRTTLAPNERPFFKTSLHWIVFVRFAVLALAVFLFAAIPFAIAVQAMTGSEIGWFALPLPAFIMLPPALAYASSELVITDRRVLIKTGIVRRLSMEMLISKIESIAVDQGAIGRMFDYGTVTVRGTGGFEEPLEAIANPILFRNWVQRMQGGGQNR